MAKKKTSEDTSTSTPSAPARRRAPAKKQVTAAPAPATANATSLAAESAPGFGGTDTSKPTQAEIAEAAYYRHLNRSSGGGSGDEFTDWIEAEQELRGKPRR